MRQAMRNRGTWHGNRPTHSVPEQEEGEPSAKQPRTGTLQLRADQDSTPEASPSEPIAGYTSSEDSSAPDLESSPTPEGRNGS